VHFGDRHPAVAAVMPKPEGVALLGDRLQGVAPGGVPLEDAGDERTSNRVDLDQMGHTVVDVAHGASGYSRDAQGFHQASEAVGVVGNAGLYTTARDLLRWEQNFADVRVGTPALVGEMQTPPALTSGDESPYGFGLFIGEHRGLRTIGHGGSDQGIATIVVRYPDQGLAIAVLCNLDTIPATVLTQRIAEIYLSDVPAVPTDGSAVAEMGRYRSPPTNWRARPASTASCPVMPSLAFQHGGD
jgi:CubicO group peptidase (beta-lactamase class C family)